MSTAKQIIDEFTAASGVPAIEMGPAPLAPPTTRPGTKPGVPAPSPAKPSKPGVRPWRPNVRPGVNPRPKAKKSSEEPWGASL